MRTTLLSVFLGLSYSSIAQTIFIQPSAKVETSSAREIENKRIARAAATANHMEGVNQALPTGYDILAFDYRNRSVRGTPFLLPNWSVGEVLIGPAAKNMAGVLKFDVYNQQVRAYRSQQGDSIILAAEQISSFTLHPTGPQGVPLQRKFERMPIGSVAEHPISFAEVLSAGTEVRLLKFYRKTVFAAPPVPGYDSAGPVDTFQNGERYFLRWADGSATQVKASKAAIIAAVAVHNPAAVAAIAHMKTNARTDTELAALTDQLNAAIAAK